MKEIQMGYATLKIRDPREGQTPHGASAWELELGGVPEEPVTLYLGRMDHFEVNHWLYWHVSSSVVDANWDRVAAELEKADDEYQKSLAPPP